MIVRIHTTNRTAMMLLKRGEFQGHLIEFSTDKDGITIVTVHTKEKGEK